MKKATRASGREYLSGARDGLPVGIAYLAVSFTFGLQVSLSQVPGWMGVLISATNLTSAGQFAGLKMMLGNAALYEVLLAVFIINSRYMLMSFSVSQQIYGRVGTGKRLAMSFFVTDEVFALATGKGNGLTFPYFMGLALFPYIGWSAGTLIGCTAGEFLPPSLQSAMGIALYCMFIAIIIPPARKSKPILFCIAAATALSCGLYYIPVINRISFGFRVIIASVAASALTALIFPHKEDEPHEKVADNAETEAQTKELDAGSGGCE